MITIWHSRDATNVAKWLIDNTDLRSQVASGQAQIKELFASDQSRHFYTQPARIKEILYLDQPDIILTKTEMGHEAPFASIEVSEEAGTGHNAFQRFGRVAAAAENGVAAFYVYPNAIWVGRNSGTSIVGSWDQLNPNVFLSLERLMNVHGVPALLYYFPTDFQGDRHLPPSASRSRPKGQIYDPSYPGCPDSGDAEMQDLLQDLNLLIRQSQTMPTSQIGASFLTSTRAQARRTWMMTEYAAGIARKSPGELWSPSTAITEVATSKLLQYLSKFEEANHDFGPMLTSRSETVIYKADAKFRADPYTGALAAIDYLHCGRGKSYEQREKNLVMAWGRIEDNEGHLVVRGRASVADFVEPVRSLYSNPNGPVKLGKSFEELRVGRDIPRYMMQVRFGTMFTKSKEIRMFAYIADAMLFHDGALWREA